VKCTHPQSETIFDAEQALAYSCNAYFAEIAKRFATKDAVSTLRDYGISETAILQTPVTTQQTQLFVLGLEGISVTPLQLADRLPQTRNANGTRALQFSNASSQARS
jgi:cell division protein FtsI/penicillin-binding protein 2